uniref:JmjC domain-containing protein n=1 Tax=Panagrolaimus davidi TaxID=227884 RepID=A0A914QB83_9BILA
MNFSLMQEIYSDPAVSLPPGWNLNDLSELKNILGFEIPGVTTCMAYAGTEYTYAPKHIEDLSLGSVNIVFPDSADKLWFGFDQKYYCAVKEAIARNFSTTCKDVLLHKCLMLDIDFFIDNNIPYCYAVQSSGQIIVTNPNGFHSVANTGRNYSEASNIYCMGTIHESLKFPLCDCPAVVGQYQKIEWQPYIKYCQNIEKSMQYSAAGITDDAEEPTVQVNIVPKRRTKTTGVIVNEESISAQGTTPSSTDIFQAEENTPPSTDIFQAEENTPPSTDIFQAEENTPPSTDIFQAEGNTPSSTDMLFNRIATNDSQDTVFNNSDNQFDNESIAHIRQNASSTVNDTANSNTQDVEQILEMLQPHLQFPSQPAPPPTLQPTPQESQRTRQARKEQGCRFRAIQAINKSRKNPPSTPPIFQSTVNEALDSKRAHLAKNKRQYEGAKESRKRANKKQQERHLGTRSGRARGIGARSFEMDLKKLKRAHAKTEKQILNHYSCTKRLTHDELTRHIHSQTTLEITRAQILRSRDVYNALVKYFTKEKVMARLIEGSTVYGITAHFINYENEHEVELFKQCLINSNTVTSMEVWNNVLASKENWIAEFGVDYAFRVPAADDRLFCDRDKPTNDTQNTE